MDVSPQRARSRARSARRADVAPGSSRDLDGQEIPSRQPAGLAFPVSSTGAVAIENGKIAVHGNLDIDEGHIGYAPPGWARSRNDVVIVGQPRGRQRGRGARYAVGARPRSRAGQRPAIRGEGSTVARRADAIGDRRQWQPHGAGQDTGGQRDVFRLRTASGHRARRAHLRRAARQSRDRRRSSGPQELAVEAGVEVTGTARVPRVRLVSNCPCRTAKSCHG